MNSNTVHIKGGN